MLNTFYKNKKKPFVRMAFFMPSKVVISDRNQIIKRFSTQ
ncbi:hypothetical protein MPR_3537 [Myroides profundi]|nr:hypothetical protein MPR_3537 [Myroides profundi]